MDKQILFKCKHPESSERYIIFYIDGTYQFDGYGRNDYSYWCIEKDTLMFKHYDNQPWRTWDGYKTLDIMVLEQIQKYIASRCIEEILGSTDGRSPDF